MNEVKSKKRKYCIGIFIFWDASVAFRSCLFQHFSLQVPRMIVNVVQILPMETLREVQKPTPGCLLQR